MNATKIDALADIRGVVRIAKAASIGVTGNGPRIERAEQGIAAVAELVEAAGKAQDTNRDDYVLARPDVSHLPEAERIAFLRGWDAASEAVYRTGLRAALARITREQAHG